MTPKAPHAKCDNCALKRRPFCPSELDTKRPYVIVGEGPGGHEIEGGRPFIGASGRLLGQALLANGLKRQDFSLLNTVSCLHWSTKIYMSDGRKLPIGYVVNHRVQGQVVSVDSNSGELSTRRITGWYRNPRAERPLVKLYLEGGKGNFNGRVGAIVTGDHLVLTRHGWLPAVALFDPGHEIATGEPRLWANAKSVIIGALLGDGGISEKNSEFYERHYERNVDLLEHMALALRSFRPRLTKVRANEQVCVDLRLPANYEIRYLYKDFYAARSNVVPKELELTPLALAVFFMGDGHMFHRLPRQPSAELAVCSYQEESVERILLALGRFGLHPRVRVTAGKYRRLNFNVADTKLLSEIIAPFVTPSFQYKLCPEHRGRFRPDLYAAPPTRTGWAPVRAETISRPDSWVYCIDVEGTHTFKTTVGVVHNCQPLRNDLHTARLQASARRKKGIEAESGDPIECCRPRFEAELSALRGKPILALGGTAAQAVTGAADTIMNVRGFPFERNDNTRVFPTVHPAFVLRSRRYKKILHADIGKAKRWFRGGWDRGGLDWTDPVTVFNPSPVRLERFLSEPEGFYAYDVETDGIDPLTTRLRCITFCHWPSWTAVSVGLRGIGDERNGWCKPPVESRNPFYPLRDRGPLISVLTRAFERLSESRRLFPHNGGYFDRQAVIHEWWLRGLKLNFALTDDTILLHKLTDPELPHSLGFVGSFLTDVYAWKSENTALEAESDEELHRYSVTDSAVTAAIVEPLLASVGARGQHQVYERDLQLQQVCVGLHETGMWIDQAERLRLVAVYEKEAAALEEKIHELLTKSKFPLADSFNPGSVQQVSEVLFEHFSLTPTDHTDTGAPSTDATSLVKLLRDVNASALSNRFLNALRRWRRVKTKYLGTYLYPAGLSVDEGGWLSRDGRIHTSWNAAYVLTGRLSSSEPANLQNVPSVLRSIFAPAPGLVFVTGDSAQLELRLIAAIAGCQNYLTALKAGSDPHAAVCEALFGKTYTSCQDKDVKKRLRRFAKEFSYAIFYGALPETILDHLSRAEGADGSLAYSDLSLGQVVSYRRKFLNLNPEIEKWWQNTIIEFRKVGYLTDALWGRRRDFTDEVNVENEVLNFRIQSTGTCVVNDATFELLDEIPFHAFGRNTGLINQCHDSLILEVPMDRAEKTKETLTHCMTRKYDNLDVLFTCEANLAKNWSKAA